MKVTEILTEDSILTEDEELMLCESDDVYNALFKAAEQLDAAKRGLGIANRLKDPGKRAMNRSRIMRNLNKIRGLINRATKALEAEKELVEGEVIRDRFKQKLKAKGMYKNPDIDVPKGFERFYTKENPSGKSGSIIGVRKNGTEKVISTGHLDLIKTLAAAYNAGGYTDKELKKISLKGE